MPCAARTGHSNLINGILGSFWHRLTPRITCWLDNAQLVLQSAPRIPALGTTPRACRVEVTRPIIVIQPIASLATVVIFVIICKDPPRPLNATCRVVLCFPHSYIPFFLSSIKLYGGRGYRCLTPYLGNMGAQKKSFDFFAKFFFASFFCKKEKLMSVWYCVGKAHVSADVCIYLKYRNSYFSIMMKDEKRKYLRVDKHMRHDGKWGTYYSGVPDHETSRQATQYEFDEYSYAHSIYIYPEVMKYSNANVYLILYNIFHHGKCENAFVRKLSSRPIFSKPIFLNMGFIVATTDIDNKLSITMNVTNDTTNTNTTNTNTTNTNTTNTNTTNTNTTNTNTNDVGCDDVDALILEAFDVFESEVDNLYCVDTLNDTNNTNNTTEATKLSTNMENMNMKKKQRHHTVQKSRNLRITGNCNPRYIQF